MRKLVLVIALVLGASVPEIVVANAAEVLEVRVTIKDHRFEPDQIEVPAGREIKLIVTNSDSTPEEFESVALKVERVIQPGKTTEFRIRPLRANRSYKFFGEFHPDTAQGQLIAK